RERIAPAGNLRARWSVPLRLLQLLSESASPFRCDSFNSYKGHLLSSQDRQKFAAVALLHAEVLEPIAVDQDGCAAPGVVNPDAVEHGGDLAEEPLLARGPCPGFYLSQRPLGLFLEVVQRQQRVSRHLALEIPPYIPSVLAHERAGLVLRMALEEHEQPR